MEDQEIADGIRLRDADALSAAIEKYGGSLQRLSARILAYDDHHTDIEECVSDVFVLAWNKIARFDPVVGSFRTWLHILCKYRALDYLRKKKRKMEGASEVPEIADTALVEEKVLLQERKSELLELITSMEPVNRAIFWRYYFFSESIEAIASDLSLTRKAVENRLARGRALLRGQLSEKWRDEHV